MPKAAWSPICRQTSLSLGYSFLQHVLLSAFSLAKKELLAWLCGASHTKPSERRNRYQHAQPLVSNPPLSSGAGKTGLS